MLKTLSPTQNYVALPFQFKKCGFCVDVEFMCHFVCCIISLVETVFVEIISSRSNHKTDRQINRQIDVDIDRQMGEIWLERQILKASTEFTLLVFSFPSKVTFFPIFVGVFCPSSSAFFLFLFRDSRSFLFSFLFHNFFSILPYILFSFVLSLSFSTIIATPPKNRYIPRILFT